MADKVQVVGLSVLLSNCRSMRTHHLFAFVWGSPRHDDWIVSSASERGEGDSEEGGDAWQSRRSLAGHRKA